MRLHRTNRLLYSLRLCISYIAVFITISSNQLSLAKDYFSTASLDKRGLQSIADIENMDIFSEIEGQLSGSYTVDVYLNNDTIGMYTLDFINGDNGKLSPVLTKQQWVEWGVDTSASPEFYRLSDEAVITAIEDIIPHSTLNFDFSQQKLFLNIPHIAIKTTARGVVSPELWMQGVPAFLLDYSFSGSKTWAHHHDDRAEFLSLRSGVNLGGWRARNYSVYTHNNNNNQWNSIHTYVERDIAPLKSQLTLGETATTGNIFDGFQFIGGKLASDDSMLPYSLRGFAPIVQGIARSEAQVTIKQNGVVIYQTYVSAGPFEITDLYPSSASGNLDVIVTEIDGTEQTFLVPFSSVPIMLREGQLNYDISVGKYRENNSRTKEPHFIQSTLVYGLPWNTTLYGGAVYAANYQAIALGTGFNLGEFGALSFDMTDAHTHFKESVMYNKFHGQSYRFQYAKSLLSSGTTVTLAGYRYSTEEYYDFTEANDVYSFQNRFNKRSKLQATLSQSLADYGSVYLNGYQQDYWGRSGKEKTVSAGYNTSMRSINYGINYTYTDMPNGKSADQLFAVNFNIPFDSFLPNSRISTIMSTDNHGMTAMQVGLSGNSIDNTLNYQIQQGYGNKGQQNSGSASISYKGRNGTVNSGISYSSDYHRMNYGLQGGLVAHPNGITLSQSLGETIAIVTAPDAEGVSIQNRTGISTNSAGYAIVPYLTPYQRNRIQLDVSSLGDQVDLINNSVTVIPTKGAVVYAGFQTHIGWRALVTLTIDGKPLPFGTIVTLENKVKSEASVDVSGIVSSNGEVYLSGLSERGQLVAKWGTMKNQRCECDFLLPQDKKQPIIQLTIECHLPEPTTR